MIPDSLSGARHTLLLRLAGPMQSWGFRSRFDNRDTALEPTRSGVVGLLCAALGIGRDEPERLQIFQTLTLGVRVDAPGRVMVDYHTAQRVLKAGGGTSGTAQSWRYYLADARFLVGLESSDLGFLRVLESALQHPVWPLFLGRKSFVPSLPIHLAPSGLREGKALEAALREEAWSQVREWEEQPRPLRLMIETVAHGEGATTSDVPLDFKRRHFGLRQVQSLHINEPPVTQKEALCFFRN